MRIVCTGAVFSPDGKRIVTASSDKTARLWDADTGKPIGEPLKGHEDRVYSAAFSPDGKRIVTASADKTARLWDADTGRPIGEPLKGHRSIVFGAAFSPDGKRIVTASVDKTARLWDAETRKPIGEPLTGHEGLVNSAAFSPDGRRIVTASADNTARLWDIVTVSADNTAPLRDAVTGTPIAQRGDREDVVGSAAFRPDDKASSPHLGQDGALPGDCQHPGNRSAGQGRSAKMPDARAAQGILPRPGAPRLVHRDEEMAVPHAGLGGLACQTPGRGAVAGLVGFEVDVVSG